MGISQLVPNIVRFGVFEADFRACELRRKGVKVRLQDLPFRALCLLLSRPGELITREEFRQALWPEDLFVDFERALRSAIKRLRDALGDDSNNPIFIETVERRGYRWIAPVQGLEGTPEQRPASGRESPSRSFSSLRKPLFLLLGLTLVVAIATMWMTRKLPGKSSLFSFRSVESASASSHLPDNREAQEFYLKGRYYWEKRTPDSLNKAVDLYTQAIVHDPGYAPAYVGLADCYNLLREYTVMPASEAYPRALAAAKKAVELDPRSSEAHAALAFVSFYGMWDAATADKEFRRAAELNPNNAVAHHWYATFLSCLRRFPEALAEIERAQALEPASKSVLADKGMLLFDAGRDREATTLLQQMEQNEPDFISPHRYLKIIYRVTGQYSEYLKEARVEAVLMHDNAALSIVDRTEKAFAREGKKGLLDVLIREQKSLCDRDLFSPLWLAQTYSIQGNKPDALHYLRIAFERHVDSVEQIESDRSFETLHKEPAFQKLLAEIGLPPIS